ncbi:MAG: hypothetical protein R3C29_02415 [Dehalococcoidia bacterium]|nr:hypothetical protein [Dehalococcoidia bacterium]
MRFRDGVRSGKVMLTFRAWRRPQAKPGATHRVFGDTRIEVTEVKTVAVREITEAEAKRAGFGSREELLASLTTERGSGIAEDVDVYRVAFRFAGDIHDTPEVVGDAEVANARAKLAGIDQRSRSAAWTRETLALIRSMPATRAGDLAAEAGMDRLRFKANVRKLKYLGLTRSLGTGYELSELGARVLEEDYVEPST